MDNKIMKIKTRFRYELLKMLLSSVFCNDIVEKIMVFF